MNAPRQAAARQAARSRERRAFSNPVSQNHAIRSLYHKSLPLQARAGCNAAPPLAERQDLVRAVTRIVIRRPEGTP